jgi:hypothetical protein
MNAGNVEFWESEYLSKLEVAQQCAQSIGFEFYMDPTGEIIFKPPFWNIDVRPNFPVSWIRDIDVIDWSFGESEAEVCTHLNMKGAWTGKVNYGFGSEVQPVTSLTDYKLLRKFGWRTQDYHCDYWSNPRTLFLHGFNVMDHMNVNMHTGTVTIPIRPELRMGFPVYVEPKDAFWYVKGVNHSFSRGGRCTTSLSLTGRRAKFFGPKTLGRKVTKKAKSGEITDISYKLPVEAGTSQGNWLSPPIFLRDQTGKLIGRPNVCLAFDKGWRDMTPQARAEALGLDPRSFKSDKKINAELKRRSKGMLGLGMKDRRTFDEWLSSQTVGKTGYGLFTGGMYSLVEDDSITEVLYRSKYTKGNTVVQVSEEELDPKTGDVEETKKSSKKKEKVKHHETRAIFPVSDESGYEVVGNYRYGRGLMIMPSGEMKRKPVQTASTADGVNQADNRGFKDTLKKGYSYGSGLQPGTISAAALQKMEPGDTASPQSNDTKVSPGDTKKVVQDAKAESTGGAKADVPIEATKTDPWHVRVDSSGYARTIYELTPNFSDPLAGPQATDCACSLQRADVFLDLARTGGIFGFLREYLRPFRNDTVVGDVTEIPLERHYSDFNKSLIGSGTKRKGVKSIPDKYQANARSATAAMEVMHDYFGQLSTKDPPDVRVTVSGGGGYTNGTGHVGGSHHYKAEAMDLYIKVDGKDLPAWKVYSGIGRLIVDGKLPDNGVGYYAHVDAFSGKSNAKRSYSIVHYDVRGHPAKWVWKGYWKKGEGSVDVSKKGYGRSTMQSMIDHPERFPPGFDLAGLVASSPSTEGIPTHAQYLSGAPSIEVGTYKIEVGGGEVVGYTLVSPGTKGEIMRRIEDNLMRLNSQRDGEHQRYEKEIRGATRLQSLGLDPAAQQALLEFLRFNTPQPRPAPQVSPPALTPQVQNLSPQGFLDQLGLSLPNGVDGSALTEVYQDQIEAVFELAQLRERIASGESSDAQVQKMLNLQDELKSSMASNYFAALGEEPSDTDLLFMQEAISVLLKQTVSSTIAADATQAEAANA